MKHTPFKSTFNTSIYSTTLNTAGNSGGSSKSRISGGASVYNGYGQGGGNFSGSGTAGYVKIIYKGS